MAAETPTRLYSSEGRLALIGSKVGSMREALLRSSPSAIIADMRAMLVRVGVDQSEAGRWERRARRLLNEDHIVVVGVPCSPTVREARATRSRYILAARGFGRTPRPKSDR
jgi:hypothetical protein